MSEEFVPFELAKKLQEKGFDWQTFDWYDHLGNFNKGFIPRTLRGCPMHREYYAPTIGLAMKWLREEKKLHIEIVAAAYGYNYIISDTPEKGGTDRHSSAIKYEGPNDGGAWDKFEAVAIAGIKYCSDNLI